MRFNTDWRLLGGVAGGPAFVDGKYITGACCGYWGWLNGIPAGQYCGDGRCHLVDANGNELEPEGERQGANFFQAAGPYWAAALGDGTPIPKLRTNFGLSTPDMVPVAADPRNGDIVFVEHYSQGSGLVVHNGHEVVCRVQAQLAHFTDRVSIRDRLLSYYTPSGCRVYDIATNSEVPVAERAADWRIAMRSMSGVVLLERSDGLLTVRRSETVQGITIQTLAYYMDAMPNEAFDRFIVGWTPEPGETPASCRTVAYDVATLPSNSPPDTYDPKPDLLRVRAQVAATLSDVDGILARLP